MERFDLVERTEEFNEASERYYAEYENPEFILNKPFSEEEDFARRLFDMGVLFDRLRIGPGERRSGPHASDSWAADFRGPSSSFSLKTRSPTGIPTPNARK